MDQPVVTEPQESRREPRDPWVAAAAGLFFPPLGHIYAGSARRGILFFAILLILTGASFWAGAQSTGIGQAMAALWLVGLVGTVVDAALTARRRSGAAPRWYQRGQFYAAAPVLSFAGVVAAMAVVRASIVRPYYIPSGAMIPTLNIEDRILVDELVYHWRDPARNEIVLFHAPPQASPDEKVFVKRVIGLPGETVAVMPDTLLVDGKPAVMLNDDAGSDMVTFRHDRQRGLRWVDKDHSPQVRDSILLVNGEPRVLVTASGRPEVRGRQYRANGHWLGSLAGLDRLLVTSDLKPFGAAPGVQGSVLRPNVSHKDESEGSDQPAVIILKGKRLTLRPGRVSINGRPLKEPFTRQTPRYEMPPYQLPAHYHFVMGDNRNDSNDSHVWGPLARERIFGVTHQIFWSSRPERIGKRLEMPGLAGV